MQVKNYKTSLKFDKTYIMGILNVTPDSFYDGGKFFESELALEKAKNLIKEGADILDIGGESARPGSQRISVEEEKKRVLPVIETIRRENKEIIISIDTYKSEVAKEAVRSGADIINDISGGMFDPDILTVAAENEAYYVIMHINGTPDTMQNNPCYSEKGVVNDIIEYFYKRIKVAESYGIKREKIIIDPGIGFGKTLEHNIEILSNLDKFKQFKLPLLIGTSRKSMIGKILNKPVEERLYGTLATVALSILKGANIVRVHDVAETKDVVQVIDTIIKKQGNIDG